jgi:fimbrial chaperone protein
MQLRNLGARPVNVQLRIFRWLQVEGKDAFVETRDVVVSPPFATLPPNGEQVLRIIRTSKQPLQGEESYRLLVDQLPDPVRKTGASAVDFVVRYSIPVFFGKAAPAIVPLDWSVEKHAGGLRLTAINPSERRVRVSDLRLSNETGQNLSFFKGLAGYVLAHSAMTWTIPVSASMAARPGGRITISAMDDQGPVNGQATLRVGQ